MGGSRPVGDLGSLMPKDERAVSSISEAMSALAWMASSTRSKIERRLNGAAASICHWDVGRA